MLTESTLRRLNWRGDVPVTLLDGQVWYLARPRFRIGAVRDQGGTVTARRRSAAGPEYEAALDAFQRACEGDDAAAQLGAELGLMIALLCLNYDLTFEQAADLIQIDYGDEGNATLRRTLIETALGISPKAPGDGTGPA